jgi:hypothetical protein
MLLPMLLGKQALVVRADGSASLQRTPLTPPFPTHEQFEGNGTLDNEGKFHGKIDWQRRGDSELGMRIALRTVPPARWDELVQQVSYLTGFGGKVSEPVISPVDELETPLRITYTYDREDYGGWAQGMTSPLMPRITLPDLSKSDTKIEFYLGPVGDVVMHSKIELPPGSDPLVSAGSDLVEAFGEYHAAYTYKDGVLEGTRRLVVKTPMVSAEQYPKLQKFIKAIDDDQDALFPLHARARGLGAGS